MISQTTSWLDPLTGFEYLMITTGDAPELVKLVSVQSAEAVVIPREGLHILMHHLRLVEHGLGEYEVELAAQGPPGDDEKL
jgi:hypothetical protein